MAIAGLILAIVGIVIGTFMILALLLEEGYISNYGYSTDYYDYSDHSMYF